MIGMENVPGYTGPGRDKPPPERRGTGEISEAQADAMHAIVKANNPTNDPALAKRIVDRLIAGQDPLGAPPVIVPAYVPPTPAVGVNTPTAQAIRTFDEDLDDLLAPTVAEEVIAATPAEALQQVLTQAPIHPVSVSPAGGLRYDVGKNRLELIPPEWVWGLADVLTQGAKKYAERNWEKGMAWSKMVGCVLRHLYKFAVGERYDPETGCHHLAMAAWNCLALMSYDLRTLAGTPTGQNDIPPSTVRILELVNSKLGTIDKKAA